MVWDILGLGRTREEIEHILSFRAPDRDDLQVVDPRPWAKNAAMKVRDYVIPLLENLPEKKLKNGKYLGTLS